MKEKYRRRVLVRKWGGALDAEGRKVYENRILDVEISINLETLLNAVGVDAARNKTGRSRMAGGLIKAKVIK